MTPGRGRRGLPRAGLGAALSLVLAGCGAAAGTEARSAATGPCASAEVEAGRTWNDRERARVRAALTAVGPPYATRTATEVTTLMDAASAGWLDGERSLCAGKGRQSADLRGALVACYGAALSYQRAAVAALLASDRTTLPYAVDVAESALAAVGRCRHSSSFTPFAPADEPDPARAEQGRSLLARASVLLVQADYPGAKRQASRAEDLGLRTDDARLTADARVLRATAALRQRSDAEATTILSGVGSPYDEAKTPLESAALLRARADAAARAGNAAEALRLAEHAHALVERRLGTDSAEALDYEARVAEAERTHGDTDRAVARYARIIERAEHGDGQLARTLAGVHGALGHVYADLGATKEAERELYSAVAVAEKAYGVDHPRTAAAEHAFAELLATHGDFARARPLAERALMARTAAFGDVSLVVAESLLLEGRIGTGLGQNEVAVDAYGRALGVFTSLLGEDSREAGDVHRRFGQSLAASGRLDEALHELQRALAIQEDSKDAPGPDLAETHEQVGSVLLAAKRYDDALFEHHLAVKLLSESLGPSSAAVAAEQARIAGILELAGKLDDATETYREVLRLDEGAYGKDHPATGSDHRRLGVALGADKQFPEAVTELRLAVSIHERALGKTHPDVAEDRRRLGLVLAAMGKKKDALVELGAALGLYEAATPRDAAAIEELKAAIAAASNGNGNGKPGKKAP